MATALVQHRVEAEPYGINLLSSPDEIHRLSLDAANFLSPSEANCHPEFFLASVSSNWKPRLAVVRQGRSIIGMVYGKERRVAGVDSGVVCVDAVLGAPRLGAPRVRERVFREAACAFLRQPATRALRFVVPSMGPEVTGLIAVGEHQMVDITAIAVENHSIVRLPFSYPAFLEQLTDDGRSLFINCRQKSEAANRTFISGVPHKAFQYGMWQMIQKHVEGASLEAARRASKMLSQATDPLIMGLRSSSGAWLSLAAGWYEHDRAIIMLHVSDDEGYPNAALPQVLQGYLAERLIRDGIREVVFCDGVEGPLARLTRRMPATKIEIKKRWNGLQTARWGLQAALEFFTPEGGTESEWIAPASRAALALADASMKPW